MWAWMVVSLLAFSGIAVRAEDQVEDRTSLASQYRSLTLEQLSTPTEWVHQTLGAIIPIKIRLRNLRPTRPLPILIETELTNPAATIIEFYDRLLAERGSTITVGLQTFPVYCVWTQGQDNREVRTRHEFLFRKIIYVVDDPTCVGPVNPNFPHDGGRRTRWSTYLQIENWGRGQLRPQSAKWVAHDVEHSLQRIR